MATKTIALDARVYERLARLKGESESFSKVIDRLVDESVSRHTGATILAMLEGGPEPLTDREAARLQRVVEQNRKAERWALRDLS